MSKLLIIVTIIAGIFAAGMIFMAIKNPVFTEDAICWTGPFLMGAALLVVAVVQDRKQKKEIEERWGKPQPK